MLVGPAEAVLVLQSLLLSQSTFERRGLDDQLLGGRNWLVLTRLLHGENRFGMDSLETAVEALEGLLIV